MKFIRNEHLANKPGLGNRPGFALLITIVLVAFLVLILVGLASFTRVETQVAANTIALAKARQNALFALNLALSQIQKHAGPDARVTARADILENVAPSYANNPHWVGVWDALAAERLPRTWLVSGNESSAVNTPARVPTGDLNRNTFQDTGTLVSLVGNNSAGASGGVVVNKVNLMSNSVPGLTGDNIIGRYAWWVGDEGIKARVNLPERSTALTAYEPRTDLRAVARQESPRQTPVATAITGASNTDPQLDRVVLDTQLALLAGVANADVRDRFHDVSVTSLGVLANTESAASRGLKQDLSITPNLISPQFANVANFSTYMQAPGPADYTRVYRMRPPSSTASGAIIDSVAPVLTEFVLQFYIRGMVGSNSLTLRVQGLYELLNPYTSELALEPLQLIVEGLPTVQVLTGSSTTPAMVNLDDVLRGTQPRVVIHLPNAGSLVDPNLFRFLPGRLLNWGGTADRGATSGTPVPSLLATANQRTASVIQQDFMAAGTLPAALVAGDTLSLSTAGPTTLTVTLVRSSDGVTLATYESPVFDALVKGSYAFDSNSSAFTYRFRLRDRSNFLPPAGWLEDIEPRHPSPPPSFFFTGTTQPGDAPLSPSAAINDNTQLFNRSASTGSTVDSVRHVQDTALFELPRAPYTNLASLQHLGYVGERPYSLGNTWGSARNTVFDRYFFSGSSAANPALGATPQNFRNQRLRLYVNDILPPPSLADFRAVPSARSSRYVLAEGQFNINSTSEAAWEAILATITIPSWDFVNPGDYGAQDTATPTANAALNGVFLRFPQSAQETYDIDQISGVILQPSERRHYRRGVIRISDDDRSALAARIVRNIKSKAAATGPFLTVRDFLDPQTFLGGESVLSEAITHVAAARAGTTWIRNERAFTELALSGDIDANSPSYLLQSDVLSSIAAAVSPRSDTFTIRAYGESFNPVTNRSEAGAWLEATVQRIPDFVESTTNPAEANFSTLSAINQTYGRKFKITQIRWLTATDI